MTLVVEDGTGIYEANSYAGLSFAQAYLHRRNRATAWDASSVAIREAALVAATDFIDKRYGQRFIGVKLFQTIDVPGFNFLQLNSQPVAANTLTIGLVVYTFVAIAGGPLDILIGATIADTLIAVATMINTNVDVSAEIVGASSIVVRHRLNGEQPEIITSSSAPVRFSWDYAQLIGGAESMEQVLEWPRDHAYTRAGNTIVGMPAKLRQATVEYASRAIASGLMPDPVTSDTGQHVNRKFEKVGPIEEETVYSAQVQAVFKKYPEADLLLTDLLSGSGGVIR